MIIREWRGRATLSNLEAYPKHFRDHVAPELRKVPGFILTSLARPSERVVAFYNQRGTA